jgi:hypothetical protein
MASHSVTSAPPSRPGKRARAGGVARRNWSEDQCHHPAVVRPPSSRPRSRDLDDEGAACTETLKMVGLVGDPLPLRWRSTGYETRRRAASRPGAGQLAAHRLRARSPEIALRQRPSGRRKSRRPLRARHGCFGK